MPTSARQFFTSAYGDRDPVDEGAVETWIDTPAGKRELILDPGNLRVKVLGLGSDDLDVPTIADLAAGLHDDAVPYTKFTAYALPGDEAAWESRRYRKEGVIQGFFNNGIDAHIWALYGEDGRNETPRGDAHDEIVALASGKEPTPPEAPDGYACTAATVGDAGIISELMGETFSAYASAMDEGTIAASIRDETHRFRLIHDSAGELAAVTSAEIDHKRRAAEMTDCATRTDERGKGLMSYLLWRLERDMVQDLGIRDLYTLARADETGMNCVFAKLGYDYTGRLVNNCRMPNGWESMNIWCRRVERVSGLDPALAF